MVKNGEKRWARCAPERRRAAPGGGGGPARAAAGRAPPGRRRDLQPARDRRGVRARARAPGRVPPGARPRGPRPRRARCYTEDDLETAKDAAALAEAGFPFDDTLEVTRVLGRGMSRYAEALRVLFAQTFLEPGDSEVELARRLDGRRRRAAAAVEPHARPRLPPAHAPAAAHRLHRRSPSAPRARSPTPRRRRSPSPTSSASPSWGRPSTSRSSAASPAGSRSSRATWSSRPCGSSSRSATR